MKYRLIAATALAAPIALAHPALAKVGDPVKVSDGLTIDPIIDGRLRYEHVDQPATPAVPDNADALSMRIRAGAEFKLRSISFLVEGEGTFAMIDNYNDTNALNGIEPYPVVADPNNIELNRLQLQYKGKTSTLTFGRQRINLDDQRWVGSVGWRQNEQTFDAVRGETTIGPVYLDGTYAISQRTIFGIDAGPRQHFDGNFFFAGAGVKAGPVNVKGFAYLLDYDGVAANSTQTYGVRATAAIPVASNVKLNLVASYAEQFDYKGNPFNFSLPYMNGEIGTTIAGFGITAGYERLGSQLVAPATYRSLQTPFATGHKFQGWADLFLVTPPLGIQDYYAGVSYGFKGIKALPGLNAAVVYHQFDSDKLGVNYGEEWDASIGFKLAGRFAILAKYADYNAKGFGVDTRKFWLQVEFAY